MDIETGTMMQCSIPPILSDVFAQSFAQSIGCVVNGTRNGAIWNWDPRMPRCGSLIDGPTKEASVCWAQCLTKRPGFIVARTNGLLQYYDFRVNRCATEYIGNLNTHYRVACALDPSESVVIAGGTDGKINFWKLNDSLPCFNLASTSKGPHSLACETKSDSDVFSVWATSRQGLFVISYNPGFE